MNRRSSGVLFGGVFFELPFDYRLMLLRDIRCSPVDVVYGSS
jgi:hypothetical protein